MNTKFPGTTERRIRWWAWPFLILAAPFAFVGAVLGFAAFLAMIAIWMAFTMPQSWRERRRAERKLTEEGRLIRWEDAIEVCGVDGTGIALELGTKDFISMWLVKLPPEAHAEFLLYPTYASWTSDPRGDWRECMELDKSSPQLVTNMQFAKRIENRPENLDELDAATKDSIRIISVFNDASPSALLYKSIRNNKNA